MSPKKQQLFKTSELLEDINYVNKANKDEIQRIKDRVRLCITEAELADETVNAIIEEVSNQLAQLSVKVKLAEKAVHSIEPRQWRESTSSTARDKRHHQGPDLRFNAGQLAGHRNLLPIESSGDTSFLWSGSSPEIQFTFSLDRSKILGMQIRLFALIKPEFSKQLMVSIDNTHVKHKFGVDDGLFVVSCNLPPSSSTGQTNIKIVLPDTHRPVDLGTSNDARKLGIAIHEIHFGKPESRVNHLLKRLRLSK